MEHQPQPNHYEHEQETQERDAIDDRVILILAGIDQARESRCDIDDLTARLIALFLADSTRHALADYAYTGRGTNARLRDEYLSIYHHENTNEATREIIDWFGAKHVYADGASRSIPRQPAGDPRLGNLLWPTHIDIGGSNVPVRIPADQPNQVLQELPANLAPMLKNHGTAFRLFLNLPDINATATNLTDTFDNTFRGEYESTRELLAELTDAATIRKLVARIHQEHLGGEHVTFDEDALMQHLHEMYDIVHHQGKIYVFAE